MSQLPVWLIILADQLSVIGLVSRYLTNYLILRGLIEGRFHHIRVTASADSHVIYAPVRLPEMEKRSLACVKHFASVHSEPGSNSIHYIKLQIKE